MYVQHDMAIAGIGLVVLVVLGLLGALFYFQKTRPIGWMLLGVLVACLFGLFIVDTRSHPQAVPSYQYDVPTLEAPIDVVDALVAPRIPLDAKDAVADHSANPPQAAQPLETQDAHADEADAAADAKDDESEEGAAPHPVEDSPRIGHAAAAVKTSGPRPSWLDPGASRSNAFQFIVETDAASRQQADVQVNQEIVIKTAEVLDNLVGTQFVHDRYGRRQHWSDEVSLHQLLNLGFTPGEIRDTVWKAEYVEQSNLDLQTGPFPMVKVYTLLEYTPEFRNELQLRWRQHRSQQRLFEVGIVAACILGGLSLVWGVLKFDTVTKGYYTKRLIVTGLVVTMVVIGAFVVALSS